MNMTRATVYGCVLAATVAVVGIHAAQGQAQGQQSGRAGAPPAPQTPQPPTRASILRGEYGEFRANNDLLYYHLDIRIDPEKKTISGKNTIRFKMLTDGTRIQIDLYANLNVDKILFGSATLNYTREENAVFINFPEKLKKDKTYSIDFYYSGTPKTTGRFGGFVFGADPQKRPWIFTACEGEGSAIWWPSKDQWHDEVENMDLSVSIPNGLVDASNGKFVKKTDLGDGYTRWDWAISYPINSYCVSLNIGTYEEFTDDFHGMTIRFFALPEDLDKAREQFQQAKGMLEAYVHYFGEYPFAKDGYKLIQVPYTGMEHQSAVTYGNGFRNGYGGRDWTGVGVSPKFDFIIIHESAHEWFGNAVSAADVSDMWIQEGWATYLECMYVEYRFGYDDALKYTNGYKSHVTPPTRPRRPIITPHGIHQEPPQDMYFKGALFLHTLRNVINDDAKWWKLVHDTYQKFKYRNIMTEEMVQFFNAQTGRDLTAVFNQYLRYVDIPTLELKFDEPGSVSYRWKVDEKGFTMPIRVGDKANWTIIQPTTEWQTMKTPLTKDSFDVATDLYYVNVSKTP